MIQKTPAVSASLYCRKFCQIKELRLIKEIDIEADKEFDAFRQIFRREI